VGIEVTARSIRSDGAGNAPRYQAGSGALSLPEKISTLSVGVRQTDNKRIGVSEV